MQNNILGNISDFAQAFGSNTSMDDIRAKREQELFKEQQRIAALDDQRKGALFQDARSVNTYLKAGQPQMALGVLSDRIGFIEQFGGDPRDTKEVADLIAQGDIQGAINLLDSIEQAGIGAGYLKAPQGVSELDQVKLEKAKLELEQMQSGEPKKDKRVQNSRDVPGGTIITYTDGSQEFKRFGEEVNQAAMDVAQRDRPKLTSSMQNKQLEFQESANEAYSLADKTKALADKFSMVDVPTGVAGATREAFVNILGTQDDVSNLRKDFTRIRNKLITSNLPQGPATDKDIELIAAGFPQATASKDQIVDFLKAMSRGQEAIAKFDEFKSLFLQENGNITRAVRDFEFDGQNIKKGERLAPSYKRISKSLKSRQDAPAAKPEQPAELSEADIFKQYGLK